MNNPSRHVFVLMPFKSTFQQLWEKITLAAEAAGAKAERVDKQLYEEQDVLTRIIGQIEDADAIVAVMTGKSPNVFFEVGIAHALGKHVVLLTANPDDIPFDVSHLKHVPYKTSPRRPNSLIDPEELTTNVTNELKFALSNPRVTDSYYQEFKKAMNTVEASSSGLSPYLTPVATDFFGRWTNFIQDLVHSRITKEGSMRLAITHLLVHATKRYRVVERILGLPRRLHSADWISFYDEVGNDGSIQKIWILCINEQQVASRIDEVTASWQFRKARNFDTHYCSPEELRRSGQRFGDYDVIEDYGEFAKLLWLKEASYIPQDDPNSLLTSFIKVDENHRRLMETLIRCSETINEKWLQRHRDTQVPVGAAV